MVGIKSRGNKKKQYEKRENEKEHSQLSARDNFPSKEPICDGRSEDYAEKYRPPITVRLDKVDLQNFIN